MNAREFLTTTQDAIREDEGGRARYIDAMWRWRNDLEHVRNADRKMAYRTRRSSRKLMQSDLYEGR